MGEYIRRRTQIRDFWPDDTETCLYIGEPCGMDQILERAEEKWPGVKMTELSVCAQYIHTRCLGYDLYDPGDYTEFVVITRIVPEKMK